MHRFRENFTAGILLVVGFIVILTAAAVSAASGWRLVGWNDLGMHCMDGTDFSVYSVLPPFNTIHAQLIDPNGALAGGAGVTVTYQAVADPSGSINTSSSTKTNFWQYMKSFFGVSAPPDTGLTGNRMPGSANIPQPMMFDAASGWFTADGIPLTPFDDAGRKNPYPMMRLTARDSFGNVLATTDIVLPVSDEMDCKSCHSSSSGQAAQPPSGWAFDPDPNRDVKINALRLHDDLHKNDPSFASALASAGFNPKGLEATSLSDGHPILCAACHASNALPGTGIAGVTPLTQGVHGYHAGVVDPATGTTLDAAGNRTACYRCHPGSTTKCLRGVMGNSVAADGSMAIQCQSCHGSMSTVGINTRQGWLDEPTCQSCHTGTATHNNGQIRYTSVFDVPGHRRAPVDGTFATNANTPGTGFSLYRFSTGHGGLYCESCHGSTHAEFPSSHTNDNIQSVEIQGHAGLLSDCTACHGSQTLAAQGGPHGMHPVGQPWVSAHSDYVGGNLSLCQGCHGSDLRGTVLSRALGDRTLNTEDFGQKLFWQGFQVGCYACHNGPSSESPSPNNPPAAKNASASTTSNVPVGVVLSASDPDGNALTYRIVSQPSHGTVGLNGPQAVYYPDAGYAGADSFTFSAWDGSVDSNLATIAIQVLSAPPCAMTCAASAPATAIAGQILTFTGSATASNCSGSPVYDWNFGDNSAHGSNATATHAYAVAGSYSWTFTVSAAGVSCVKSGKVSVAPAPCTVSCSATVPPSARVKTSVKFQASATTANCGTSVLYAWNFGDGTAHSTAASSNHTYQRTGTFSWKLTATSGSSVCTKSGKISVTTH